jgi:hypothetical protein
MSLQNIQAEFSEIIFSDDEHPSMIIYRNNIFSTLVRTLLDIYPMIASLIGEDCFRNTAKEYIRNYPSRSANLNEYGEYFSDFLTEYAPINHLYYLPEVAIFEWYNHVLHFANDHAPFNIQSLSQFTPNQYDALHFVLHPASRLHQFNYPILRIIDLCKNKISGELNLDNEDCDNLLIMRRNLEIVIKSLSPAEFVFLAAVRDNMILSDALELALLSDPTFKLDEKLPTWIQEEIIVDCY